jgi:replicative DNA helicase
MANDARELYKLAQRRLIASLVFNGEGATRVFEIITVDDVEEPALNLIITAVVELVREDTAISVFTVAKQLEGVGALAQAGGLSELYALRNEGRQYLLECPVEIYADVVKESSARNSVSRIVNETSESLKADSGTEVTAVVSNLQSQLNEQLYRLSDDSTSSELSEAIADYLNLIEERKIVSEENAKDANGLQGVPMMIPTLNKITTGLLPGQLITVGARTGVGKSVFAINSAVAACEANKSVQFFSLEMSEVEIQDRIIASMSGIPMNDLKQGKVSEEDRETLRETSERVSHMKLLIETEPKITVDAIRAKALRRAQSPQGLDLIIIDYLQLITPVGNFSSRQEIVADLSRNMKLLSKQLGVPIIILVQLNREKSDGDENALPKLDQIRESGAIAQDSDIVILLHRDKSEDGEIPHTLIILAKHRNGEAGAVVRCHSNLECSLFREVVRAKDKPRMTDEEMNDLVKDSDFDDFDSDLGGIDEFEDLEL